MSAKMANVAVRSREGRVASLHLHPKEPGAGLRAVDEITVVATKGIEGDERYFGRLSRDTGAPSPRQISLIEREQLGEHARALGLGGIGPGAARSNVETTGIDLVGLLGCEVEIGEALLFLYAAREPCAKMDAVCEGLRERMQDNRQGVLAEVRRGGVVRVGDPIRVSRGKKAGSG